MHDGHCVLLGECELFAECDLLGFPRLYVACSVFEDTEVVEIVVVGMFGHGALWIVYFV